MRINKITTDEVNALSNLVEQAFTDASFNELDPEEEEQLDLVVSLMSKIQEAH